MINLTPNAIEHLSELGVTNLKIAVVGGGCSGYSYKLDDVESSEITDKDTVIQLDKMKVIVDEKSAPLLKGLVLDFEGGLNGQGFTFQNPQAKKCCGCGTSFSCN